MMDNDVTITDLIEAFFEGVLSIFTPFHLIGIVIGVFLWRITFGRKNK